MDTNKIKNIQKLSEKLTSFKECYSDCKLRANIDGEVEVETLLSWMIENSWMFDIASEIKKLNEKI